MVKDSKGTMTEYQNALMSSPPRHPFWKGMLKRVFEEDPIIAEKLAAKETLGNLSGALGAAAVKRAAEIAVEAKLV